MPVIGDTTGTIGEELRRTAARAEASGQDARQHIRRLAVLLGLAVALGPAAPVLVLHLPRRLGWSGSR